MRHILLLRARRFQALYRMLTVYAVAVPPKHGDLSDHLSRDVGLPQDRLHERSVSQLGIYTFPGRP